MFNKVKKLHDAIRQNDADQVTSSGLTRSKYFKACLFAVEQNADKALSALLARNGFNFSGTGSMDRERTKQLVSAAKASSNPALLAVLFEANQKTYFGSVESSHFINEDTSLEAMRLILENDPGVFNKCLSVALSSVDKFKAVLAIASTLPEHQLELNNALVQVAATGNIEMSKMLLERKANPNSGSGKALLRAAECGHVDMVDFLLQHTKPELCGDIAILLQQQDNAPCEEIIHAIEKKADTQDTPVETSQETKAGNDGFVAENENILSETVTLHDGTQLMTLFNFSAGNAVAIHKMNGSTSSVASPVSFEAFKPEFIEQRRAILDKQLEAQKAPARIIRRSLIN